MKKVKKDTVNIADVTKSSIDWGETEKNWLKSILRDLDVTIEFVKKDGSLRKMICTLSESKIPIEKTPKNTGKAKTDDVLAVFDVENDGWRSFRWDSIKKIEFKLPGE
jgi:uncharacterized phage-like protein YoqJ